MHSHLYRLLKWPEVKQAVGTGSGCDSCAVIEQLAIICRSTWQPGARMCHGGGGLAATKNPKEEQNNALAYTQGVLAAKRCWFVVALQLAARLGRLAWERDTSLDSL